MRVISFLMASLCVTRLWMARLRRATFWRTILLNRRLLNMCRVVLCLGMLGVSILRSSHISSLLKTKRLGYIRLLTIQHLLIMVDLCLCVVHLW